MTTRFGELPDGARPETKEVTGEPMTTLWNFLLFKGMKALMKSSSSLQELPSKRWPGIVAWSE
jgi:hypothetical protein